MLQREKCIKGAKWYAKYVKKCAYSTQTVCCSNTTFLTATIFDAKIDDFAVKSKNEIDDFAEMR